jgi:hypothetical protein
MLTSKIGVHSGVNDTGGASVEWLAPEKVKDAFVLVKIAARLKAVNSGSGIVMKKC